MDASDDQMPLARKIAAHRPRPAEDGFSLERALFTALARVAERQLHLPVALREGGLASRTGGEIAELLPDHALVLLIEGPEGALGTAVLDPGTLSGLSEQLMLGRIGATPPDPRKPTRTDAVMMAGFLDAVLTEFDQLIAEEGFSGAGWATGFRYSAHLSDPRPLALMLEAPLYHGLRLSLALGGAEGRPALLSLAMPARGAPAPALADCPQRIAAGAAEPWGAPLSRVIERVEVEVEAVLGRVTLPLADLLRLEAGHSLPLSRQALHMVQVEGEDGRLICLAQLGQGNGHRILRLRPAEEGQQPIGLAIGPTVAVPASEQPLTRPPAHAPTAAEDGPLAADLASAGGQGDTVPAGLSERVA
ncbi:FliM/FliN family flagellar motor C-terminal domain-containing protein [Frigidibacter sp. RF13]|uniref:FliM/FliN family flagellar motor C-terminal domain-containing protein n=1 Tax=Frigidibacter sp. RF13 TaxID=2997340 RepID=UPI00226E526C|nr:FliM/FliN family flagellar motor C-terminal domain-containing protein [Frigidibacter sp. RF13]MCY1125582.1 FliM/FliN family flagellar motor C-terminal domain-containing protein [Frigidibacter sp. RF13]